MLKRTKTEKEKDYMKPIMVKLSWIKDEVDVLGCAWCHIYKNSPCEEIFHSLKDDSESNSSTNELRKCINKNKTELIQREAEFRKIKNDNKKIINKRISYLESLEEEEEE